ncbi:unnamed protein product [Orchesella dallaii]|uniref:CRAL-TRIO domain-containing protein n=1 Tax=Orchesella dallaii TaxID=48710 RepID=A0ABP1QC26_9HEXA
MVFSPTAEEHKKLQQLKTALQEHLLTNRSTNPKIRDELKKIAVNPDFLFKYLRGRKLNVNRALENILYYAEVKWVIYPEYFSPQVPDYVRYAIECKLLSMLSKKDELGRTYIYVDSTKYDDSQISAEKCANGFRYIVENLMDSPDFLDNGLIVLLSGKGIQMKHCKNASNEAKFYMKFWRGFPGKLKAFIYFDAPFVARALSSIVKPLITSKVVDRAYTSSGMGDLHKRVSLDILPASLGGKLGEEEAILPTDKLMALAYGK